MKLTDQHLRHAAAVCRFAENLGGQTLGIFGSAMHGAGAEVDDVDLAIRCNGLKSARSIAHKLTCRFPSLRRVAFDTYGGKLPMPESPGRFIDVVLLTSQNAVSAFQKVDSKLFASVILQDA